MKEYRYKGLTFFRTDIVCGNDGRYLYEIPELKAAGKRPFLTSIEDVKEFIRDSVEED